MNVTTLPVGNTGQFLEGVAVSTGVRESVILTSPTDPNGFAEIVSSQPINFYGLPVWLQGSPNVNVTNNPAVSVSAMPPVSVSGTSQVFGTVSTQIVSSIPLNIASSVPHAIVGTSQIFGTVSSQIISSIPFFVAQSSAPWLMNGALAVTNSPNVNVTNVPAVTITSSIPFFVAQSSSPWGVNGAISVTNAPNVNVTNVPAVNISSSIPFFVAQSSAPWSMNVSTIGSVSTQVVSSIPFFVSQSSAPWSFVETVSTAGGMNATTISLQANLNTTVVKATPGQVYGILGVNFGSTNVFVRFLNASTAATAIASTGVALVNFGMQISTSPYNNYDAGIPFSAGIAIITQQQPYTASSSVAPTASTATITILFK